VLKRPRPLAIWLIGIAALAAFLNGPALYAAISSHYHFDEVATGYVATAEFLGLGVGAGILALTPAARFEWCLCVGCILVAASNLLGYWSPSGDLWVIVGLRAVAGTGAGIVRAYVYLWCGTATSSTRAFGSFYATQLGYAAIGYNILHALTSSFGGVSIFLFYGVLGLAAVAIAANLPKGWGRENSKSENDPPPTQSRVLAPATFLALTGIWMHALSQGHTWPFLQKLGEQQGYSSLTLSFVMSAVAVAGILGSVLAAVTPQRFEKTGVLGLGTLVLLIATWGLHKPVSLTVFAVAAVLVALYFAYVYPLLLSAVSRKDPRGRLAVFAAAASCFGIGVGPAVAGHAIDRFGYGSLGPIIFVLGTLASVLVFWPVPNRASSVNTDELMIEGARVGE
jgi:predicted MFS family arabinose efflux permease